MRRWSTSQLIFAVVVGALAAGVGVRDGLPAVASASAQDGGAGTPDAAVHHPRDMCRLFVVDLDKDRSLDTGDRTTEIGKWVGEREDAGWDLQSVDFETGLKATGFPQGWIQVCVSPTGA
jgi:hypothetical protein